MYNMYTIGIRCSIKNRIDILYSIYIHTLYIYILYTYYTLLQYYIGYLFSGFTLHYMYIKTLFGRLTTEQLQTLFGILCCARDGVADDGVMVMGEGGCHRTTGLRDERGSDGGLVVAVAVGQVAF